MYTQNDIAMLYLDNLRVSYKTICDILKIVKEPQDIFLKKHKELISNLLPAKALERADTLGLNKLEEMLIKDLEKYNIFAVTIFSNLYPTNLKNIPDPPFVLYCKGDVNLLKTQKIGIVGTRTPTNYGRDVANKFTKELVQAGLVTISGLSYGIDTCVAVTTLENNGKTIAVLGGGLDSIYPAQNVELSKKIASTGLLVSEYPPHIKPRQFAFIRRNRIISGLSDGVLVVEAGIKSGATSTAMFAVEQGRELFVVPGNITSKLSEGTNDLINEMPDCFTINTNQILKKLNVAVKPQKKENKQLQLDFLSQQIVECLQNGEVHFDEICLKLNQPANTLASTLTMLEIMGIVKKLSGNFYSLVY